jgi:CheY-like chemotaxis protein/anti-sigma regulatory factor (Ser/Thr protein kinase)
MNGQSNSTGHDVGTGMGAGMSVERLADLAHELRAPLGGIDAMVALLAESRAASDQEKLIEGLKAASAHLRSVANALLQPRIDPMRSVAVEDGLKFFAVAAASRAAARGLAYRQTLAAACERAIVADGTVLRQILENLVDNAVRHAEGGEVTLAVGLDEGEKDSRCLRFEMTNRGAPLSPSEAGALFTRQQTPEHRPSGAGLGLSIVAGLVSAAGGAYGVVPAGAGAGVTVWFTLPITGFAASETKPPVAATPPIRLLIVEDDATNQLLLKTVLEHMGYVADTTGSPNEALRLLAQTPYAAVFTDISMPEMDGRDLIRAIRALPGPASEMPVICVTGRVLPEDTRMVLQAGGNWVVRKPVTIHDLRQALIATGLRDPLARQVSSAA